MKSHLTPSLCVLCLVSLRAHYPDHKTSSEGCVLPQECHTLFCKFREGWKFFWTERTLVFTTQNHNCIRCFFGWRVTMCCKFLSIKIEEVSRGAKLPLGQATFDFFVFWFWEMEFWNSLSKLNFTHFIFLPLNFSQVYLKTLRTRRLVSGDSKKERRECVAFTSRFGLTWLGRPVGGQVSAR